MYMQTRTSGGRGEASFRYTHSSLVCPHVGVRVAALMDGTVKGACPSFPSSGGACNVSYCTVTG